MARAKSSLPVPLAPSINTVLSLSAICGKIWKICRMAALRPTISAKLYFASSSLRRSSAKIKITKCFDPANRFAILILERRPSKC